MISSLTLAGLLRAGAIPKPHHCRKNAKTERSSINTVLIEKTFVDSRPEKQTKVRVFATESNSQEHIWLGKMK